MESEPKIPSSTVSSSNGAVAVPKLPLKPVGTYGGTIKSPDSPQMKESNTTSPDVPSKPAILVSYFYVITANLTNIQRSSPSSGNIDVKGQGNAAPMPVLPPKPSAINSNPILSSSLHSSNSMLKSKPSDSTSPNPVMSSSSALNTSTTSTLKGKASDSTAPPNPIFSSSSALKSKPTSSNPSLSGSNNNSPTAAQTPIPAPLKPKPGVLESVPLKTAPIKSEPVPTTSASQKEERDKSIERLDSKKLVSNAPQINAAISAVLASNGVSNSGSASNINPTSSSTHRARSNSANGGGEILDQAVEWMKIFSGSTIFTKANLFDNLNDGILLIKALEKVTKTPAPKFHVKATMIAHRIDNFNVALGMISKVGISINVAAQELHDKDPKKIAVMFQALMAKYPLP